MWFCNLCQGQDFKSQSLKPKAKAKKLALRTRPINNIPGKWLLAASRAAPWWVTLNMRLSPYSVDKKDGTDRQRNARPLHCAYQRNNLATLLCSQNLWQTEICRLFGSFVNVVRPSQVYNADRSPSFTIWSVVWQRDRASLGRSVYPTLQRRRGRDGAEHSLALDRFKICWKCPKTQILKLKWLHVAT